MYSGEQGKAFMERLMEKVLIKTVKNRIVIFLSLRVVYGTVVLVF